MNKIIKYFCFLLVTVLMLNAPISAFTLIDSDLWEIEDGSSNDHWSLSLEQEATTSTLTNTYSTDINFSTTDDFADNTTTDNLKSSRIPDPIQEPETDSVPEPGTLLLLGFGLVGVIALKKKL